MRTEPITKLTVIMQVAKKIFILVSLLVIAFLLLCTEPVKAAIYYVATTGNNSNPGTIGSPFLTPQKCHDVMVAGDTCNFRGGTYTTADANNSLFVVTTSGTAANKITYQAFTGEIPIFTGPASDTSGFCMYVNGAGNIIIDGIHTVGCRAGIYVLSGGLTIQNTDTSFAWGGGLVGPGSSNLIIQNNVVHDNVQLNWPRGAYVFRGGSWGAGLNYQPCFSCLVQNNVVYWNHGEGMQVGSIGGTNNIIKHNVIADNWSVPGFYCDGCGTGNVLDGNLIYISNEARNWPCPGPTCPPQTIDGVQRDLTPYGGRSYECGICMATEADSGGVGRRNDGFKIINNTVVNSNGGVVMFQSGGGAQTVSDIVIANNTFIANNTGIQLQNPGGTFTNFTIENNLNIQETFSCLTIQPALSSGTIDWNLFEPAGSGGCTDFHVGSSVTNYAAQGYAHSFNVASQIADSGTLVPPRLWNCDQICINQWGSDLGNGSAVSSINLAVYQLLSSSPAKDSGNNLASLGVTTDGSCAISGTCVTRPQGSAAYDMGAFEFVGTATTWTLTVSSTNPNSGVAMTGVTVDNNSQGNGSTQFTRVYNDATAVTVTAPATSGGNNFSTWVNCDSFSGAGNRTCNATMTANRSISAAYVTTTNTLTITSSNPSSCAITVTPLDNNSNGNGTTPFSRIYNNATSVTLTAPATCGGNNFSAWTRDGVSFSANMAITFPVDQDRTFSAVYTSTSVSCSGGGLVASYNFNEGSGSTAKDYSGFGNDATVNAGWTASGVFGSAITLNGTTQSAFVPSNSAVDLTGCITVAGWITPNGTLSTMSALIVKNIGNNNGSYFLYASVGSTNCGSNGVMGGFTDVNVNNTVCNATALVSGTRYFLAMTYDGANVKLYKGTNSSNLVQIGSSTPATTPPITGAGTLSIGNSVFGEWTHASLIDEVFVRSDALTLAQLKTAMDTRIGTHALTVNSTNPNSGVTIATTADVDGLSDGSTSYTRNYNNNGTLATLIAPSTASGNTFSNWTGCDSALGSTCNVTLTADKTVTAAYVTPSSVVPALSVGGPAKVGGSLKVGPIQ